MRKRVLLLPNPGEEASWLLDLRQGFVFLQGWVASLVLAGPFLRWDAVAAVVPCFVAFAGGAVSGCTCAAPFR